MENLHETLGTITFIEVNLNEIWIFSNTQDLAQLLATYFILVPANSNYDDHFFTLKLLAETLLITFDTKLSPGSR